MASPLHSPHPQQLRSVALALLLLAILTLGGHSMRSPTPVPSPALPPTAVLGEVQLIRENPRGEPESPVPSVEIIDAICITNTPTQEPC
jgi:hypothetical protein